MKRKGGKGESGVVAGMYFAMPWHLKTGMPERFKSWTSVRRGEPVIC